MPREGPHDLASWPQDIYSVRCLTCPCSSCAFPKSYHPIPDMPERDDPNCRPWSKVLGVGRIDGMQKSTITWAVPSISEWTFRGKAGFMISSFFLTYGCLGCHVTLSARYGWQVGNVVLSVSSTCGRDNPTERSVVRISSDVDVDMPVVSCKGVRNCK
jgi:hypothetical protein